MHFNLSDCDNIESKEIEGSHILLKLRMRLTGRIALVLAPKEAQSGAVFGGHNWEDLGLHPSLVDDFYRQINSRKDFVSLSSRVREGIQSLIEQGEIE